MFLRLLWESFARQRRRKLLAGVAILLGTTAVTAMLALATTIGDRIQSELAAYGANLVVYPKASQLSVKVGGVDLKPATGGAAIDEAALDRLPTIFWANNITGVSPELTLERGVTAGGAPVPVTLTGLWFGHSFGTLRTGAPQLHPWWRLEGAWPGAGDAVAGASLAAALHLRVGQTVMVAAAAGGAAVPLRITGVVHAGDATDTRLLLPLEAAQRLVAPGAYAVAQPVDRVEISARTKPEDAFARKNPDQLSPKQHDLWYCSPYANSIAYQIREALPGVQAEQVRQVEQGAGSVLERISGLMWLVSVAAMIAAAFAVSAAMATAVLERRGEIGLMRSLGASRPAIAMLFYAESALLSLAAGACGYLLGMLAAWRLGGRIFGAAGVGAGHALLNPVLLPVVLVLALGVAWAGSTPAIRSALRLDPAATLRGGA